MKKAYNNDNFWINFNIFVPENLWDESVFDEFVISINNKYVDNNLYENKVVSHKMSDIYMKKVAFPDRYDVEGAYPEGSMFKTFSFTLSSVALGVKYSELDTISLSYFGEHSTEGPYYCHLRKNPIINKNFNVNTQENEVNFLIPNSFVFFIDDDNYKRNYFNNFDILKVKIPKTNQFEVNNKLLTVEIDYKHTLSFPYIEHKYSARMHPNPSVYGVGPSHFAFGEIFEEIKRMNEVSQGPPKYNFVGFKNQLLDFEPNITTKIVKNWTNKTDYKNAFKEIKDYFLDDYLTFDFNEMTLSVSDEATEKGYIVPPYFSGILTNKYHILFDYGHNNKKELINLNINNTNIIEKPILNSDNLGYVKLNFNETITETKDENWNYSIALENTNDFLLKSNLNFEDIKFMEILNET